MYVIWIILLASALLTSFLSKIDYDAVNKEWEQQQAVESQADTDGQTVDVVNAQNIEEQQTICSNRCMTVFTLGTFATKNFLLIYYYAT
jgi:ABC-2 type transport system permease protein